MSNDLLRQTQHIQCPRSDPLETIDYHIWECEPTPPRTPCHITSYNRWQGLQHSCAAPQTASCTKKLGTCHVNAMHHCHMVRIHYRHIMHFQRMKKVLPYQSFRNVRKVATKVLLPTSSLEVAGLCFSTHSWPPANAPAPPPRLALPLLLGPAVALDGLAPSASGRHDQKRNLHLTADTSYSKYT